MRSPTIRKSENAPRKGVFDFPVRGVLCKRLYASFEDAGYGLKSGITH
jgi:hypothetical protein